MKSDRLLYVDVQILQTAAFDRGMGKYTISLLKALAQKNKQQKKYTSVKLVLNSNLDTTEIRIESIKDLLPGFQLALIDLPVDLSVNAAQKYEHARDVLTNFVSKEGGSTKIDFLISSPFFVDFPAVFPSNENVRKYSLVYDFTPYKIWHLQRIFPDEIYAHHFSVLLEADHLLTISHAVKNDLINLFGLAEETITSINGGPFDQPEEISEGLSLKKPYVLYPSAPIVHKNNERAVAAFNVFNATHGNKYTLYITSTFDEKYRSQLIGQGKNIEFTGNISDSELAKAYQGASVVFFPSLAEGLGMPVLESVLHNTPVACSDIPVLSELSKELYLFNPNDIDDMALKLTQASQREGWDRRQKSYSKLKTEYTWDNSASILMKVLGSKGTKIAVDANFNFPDTSQNNPASRLAELIYGRVRKNINGKIAVANSTRSAAFPSFAKYLDGGEPTKVDKQITLSVKRSFFMATPRKVSIKLESQGRVISSLTLYSRPFIYDKALGMKGWQYEDGKHNILSPDQIFSSIVKMIGGVK